jgi:hypothetical protein
MFQLFFRRPTEYSRWSSRLTVHSTWQSFCMNIKVKELGLRREETARRTKTVESFLVYSCWLLKKSTRDSEEFRAILLGYFCTYINNNYINSTVWPPSHWVLFMQNIRANNNVEGTRNHLKAAACKLSHLCYRPFYNLYFKLCCRTW